MASYRNGPARGEAGVQLGGENSDPRNGNPSEKQAISGAPLHLLVDRRLCRCRAEDDGQSAKCQCLPKPVVTSHKGAFFVVLANAPWGNQWKNLDREFLGAKASHAAERHRLRLCQMLAEAAWKEHSRRERLKEARRREREAAVGRIGGAR